MFETRRRNKQTIESDIEKIIAKRLGFSTATAGQARYEPLFGMFERYIHLHRNHMPRDPVQKT